MTVTIDDKDIPALQILLAEEIETAKVQAALKDSAPGTTQQKVCFVVNVAGDIQGYLDSLTRIQKSISP